MKLIEVENSDVGKLQFRFQMNLIIQLIEFAFMNIKMNEN